MYLTRRLFVRQAPLTAAGSSKLMDIVSGRLITTAIQPGARNQTGTTTGADAVVLTRSRQSWLTLQAMALPLQMLPMVFILIWLEMVRAN